MSYTPVANTARHIRRLACDARAAMALARLMPVTGRQIAVYIAAVELGLPKAAVGREAYPGALGRKSSLRNALRRIEQADPAFWAQDGARLAQPLVVDTAPSQRG